MALWPGRSHNASCRRLGPHSCPGFQGTEDAPERVTALYIAAALRASVCPVDLVGIQPPRLSRLPLPGCEESINIGVQQEDEGVAEGGMRITNRPADKSVSNVVLCSQETVHLREVGRIDDSSVLGWGVRSACADESGYIPWGIEWVVVGVEFIVRAKGRGAWDVEAHRQPGITSITIGAAHEVGVNRLFGSVVQSQ